MVDMVSRVDWLYFLHDNDDENATINDIVPWVINNNTKLEDILDG
jgi:hypothetical protein